MGKQAQLAFASLKEALVSAPILPILKFEAPFDVEIDASKMGIEVVLMQNRHLLAYISKSLGPKWQNLFVYEKSY